jgi:uncharacterized protein (DUF488 family)
VVRIWGIGHSTHALDAFVALLDAHGVRQVADVRTVPRSRRHPQFEREALEQELPARGIAYTHVPALGGWRRALPDSPNGGWRNASFRGYADYSLTSEFAAGLEELRALAVREPTAMMCSEALWWRCHRRLIADRLAVAGDDVLHIGPGGRTAAHELTRFAVVDGERLLYPPPKGA